MFIGCLRFLLKQQRLQFVHQGITVIGIGFQNNGFRAFQAAYAQNRFPVYGITSLAQDNRKGITVGDIDQGIDVQYA